MAEREKELAEARAWLGLVEGLLSLAAGVLLVDQLMGGELRRKLQGLFERPEKDAPSDPVYGVAEAASRITREAAEGQA